LYLRGNSSASEQLADLEGQMEDIKRQWEQRQQLLGNTTRAVLFKNFPAAFNERLHRQHVAFLLRNTPARAASLLDAGCGYGRTALALRRQRPALQIEGIELCEEFAKAFEATVGPCFKGDIGAYQCTRHYDVITVVTLLMYLDAEQQTQALQKLWQCLRPGGRLVLIEPCANVLTALRKLFRVRKLAPTGGEVWYFSRSSLAALAAVALPDAKIVDTAAFRMPYAGFVALHLGLALEKPDLP